MVKEKSSNTFQLQDMLMSRLDQVDNMVDPEIHRSTSWSWFNSQLVVGKTEQLMMVRCLDGEERQLTSMMHANYLGHLTLIHPLYYQQGMTP